MTEASTRRTSPIVCLEGPSAVGKTTLAAALVGECGAALVPELDATGAPPARQSASWFVDRHTAQWQVALQLAAAAPLVVLDGDPFKGLWYNWIYADEGLESVDVVAQFYRARIERGTLAFPSLYVALTATEEQLRQRRAADPTRTRHNFERHIVMLRPLRRYFAALREVAPGHVELVNTDAREELVGRVLRALERLPSEPPDSAKLLDHMAAWLRSNPPHVAPQRAD